jgi:hypothetical protein
MNSQNVSLKIFIYNWVRCCTLVIPVPGDLSQKSHEFTASLSYTVIPHLKKKEGRRNRAGGMAQVVEYCLVNVRP